VPVTLLSFGRLNKLRQLGGTFGVAVLAVVFAGNGSNASPAGMSLVSAIIAGWIPARHAAAQPELAPAAVGVEMAA
jgi:hypothetical protein